MQTKAQFLLSSLSNKNKRRNMRGTKKAEAERKKKMQKKEKRSEIQKLPTLFLPILKLFACRL